MSLSPIRSPVCTGYEMLCHVQKINDTAISPYVKSVKFLHIKIYEDRLCWISAIAIFALVALAVNTLRQNLEIIKRRAASLEAVKARYERLEADCKMLEEKIRIRIYPTEGAQEIDRFLLDPTNGRIMKRILESADSSYICPITQEIIREPVRPKDGKAYERSELQKYFNLNGRTCPYDRSQALKNPEEMLVDEELQDKILAFLRSCPKT